MPFKALVDAHPVVSVDMSTVTSKAGLGAAKKEFSLGRRTADNRLDDVRQAVFGLGLVG
jgi:hypothetical protein